MSTDLATGQRHQAGSQTTRTNRRSGAYPILSGTSLAVFAAVLVALVVAVAFQSSDAFGHDGISFIWSGHWNPAASQYGAGLLVVGTLVTTAVAMVLAVPLGVGCAVYLTEISPGWIAGPLAVLVELLAAVPSIVVGLWALLVLSPVFARDIEPALSHLPGFSGPAYGPSLLLASVVLAVMTVPTVVALTRNALLGVDISVREGARALGATRWQMVRQAVLPAARRGVAAAVVLAVGRALGESIAVALVIGNRVSIPHSLLAPGATLGSAIVNQFGEATPGLGTSSVIALAAVLLILTVIVNAAGVRLARPASRGTSSRRVALPALTRSLCARRTAGRVMELACAAATAVAVGALALLVGYTIYRGAGVVSWSFLTSAPTPEGVAGGGISTAIAGTGRLMGLALCMAVPVGLLAALRLYESGGPTARAVRFAADVLAGVPSIVIGILAYALIVEPLHHPSTTAAAFALAVLMLPVMIRGNEEALRSVPVELWEAGTALGVSRSAVVLRVVLREGLPRVVRANLLAAARAIGETAPLLFCLAAPTAAMTLFIFEQGNQAFSSAQQAAWGTALVLLAAVVILSTAARLVAWRLTRHQR